MIHTTVGPYTFATFLFSFYNVTMPTAVLTHTSALEYWRCVPAQGTAEHAEFPSSSFGRAPHRHELAGLADTAPLQQLSKPLTLLTPHRDERRSTAAATYICQQGPFPEGSFVTIGYDAASETTLAVCSPELLFIQATKSCSAFDTIALGFELCGGYMGKEPVSTPERLSSFAEKAQGMSGAKQARRYARLILPDATSLEATRLAMLVHLPRSLGGLGIAAPQLNARIPAPDEAARIIGSRHFTPDLFWPEINVAVEYDSREWHSAQTHVEHTRRKQLAYTLAGVDVISLDRTQIRELDLVRELFEQVDHKLGNRKLPVNEKQKKRQRQAHEALCKLGPTARIEARRA